MAKLRSKAVILLAAIMFFAVGMFVFTACNSGSDYTVTFMVQDSETGEWGQYDTATSVDGRVTLPSNPTKDDYVFRNWYETQDGTGDPFTGENVDGDMTVYAYFAPVLVDIHLNNKDPQEARLEQLQELTEQYTAEALSMGLTFDGWYTNAACTESYDNVNDDVTDLYGRYMAEITFNNGYEDVASQRVVAGSGVTAPSATEIANSYPYMDSEDMTFTNSEGNVVDFTSATFNTNTTITVMWKSPNLQYSEIEGQAGNYEATFDFYSVYDIAGNWPAISILSNNVTVDDNGTKGEVKAVSYSGMSAFPNVKVLMFADGIEYITGFQGESNTQVERIDLPDTLTVLEGAFGSMPSLSGVTLPEGLRVIIDSFWANTYENFLSQGTGGDWVDKVGYDFEIAVPDSVVNLSNVPTNLTFSANSCFVKEGEGLDTVIYKNEDDGSKTLIAYYNIVNNGVQIPEGYAAIQVGIFHDFYLDYLSLPSTWTSVSYNEAYNAIDGDGDLLYPYYTGEWLYNSANANRFTTSQSLAYTIFDALERAELVVSHTSAYPSGMGMYVLCGYDSTFNMYMPCMQYQMMNQNVVYAPYIESGNATVTVESYNTVTQQADESFTMTIAAGETVSEADLSEAIAKQLGFDGAEGITIVACRQLGFDYDYTSAVNCNLYLTVEYSLDILGFKYELNEEETGYIVTDFDATTAMQTDSGYIVNIPNEIDGIPVLEISDGAFENEQQIYMVYIGSNVVRIGNRAFANTPYLTSVQVASGALSVIGESAFENAGSRYDANSGKYVANQTLTIQIPLETLTDIQPYAFKSVAIAAFTPVAGEEDRIINDYNGNLYDDLTVGEYYYDRYMQGNGFIAILKYVGQTETGSPKNIDGSDIAGADTYKIYDFDFVALAAGYSNAQTRQTSPVEFGRSFIGYGSTVDWVARYRILEGSVYYLDDSWGGGIIFGIVSGVEENAFTDCDLDSIGFHWHADESDCWIDSSLITTDSREIFTDGWFNGIHSTDDEYAALSEKLASASRDTSALVGMWQ